MKKAKKWEGQQKYVIIHCTGATAVLYSNITILEVSILPYFVIFVIVPHSFYLLEGKVYIYNKIKAIKIILANY